MVHWSNGLRGAVTQGWDWTTPVEYESLELVLLEPSNQPAEVGKGGEK